jgi:hypothetical protein
MSETVSTLGACLVCLRLALDAEKNVFGGFKHWGQEKVKQGDIYKVAKL